MCVITCPFTHTPIQLTRYIVREPRWFQAVLNNLPLPLPPRAPPSRSDYNLPPPKRSAALTVAPKYGKPLNLKALLVVYLEDELRRQFFIDHPFEATRPKTLVEEGVIKPEHPVSEVMWRRLRRRGWNLLPEEYVHSCVYTSNSADLVCPSAIRYAVNLHEHHGLSVNQAYSSAVNQFRWQPVCMHALPYLLMLTCTSTHLPA